MSKIISKTIELKVENMPFDSDFVEQEIIAQGLLPVRWAIVNVNDNILTISVSGYLK